MTNAVIAITGGNSGIGLAITTRYLQLGCRVAILARDLTKMQSLQTQYPEQLMLHSGDVTRIEDLSNFFESCAKRWGKIDSVIANAGIAIPESLRDVTEASFERSVNVNVKGVFFTVQKALPFLNDKASIILMSSVQANRGAGIWSVYGATKAAVRALTRSFAEELGPLGIRVNALSPGVTDTPILNKFGFAEQQLTEILDSVASRTPLGRLATAEEIADAALYLSSDQARFITGADLQVDGGLTQI